ncbi:hypothetical protein GSI_08840 [Ganoderma sinense ZZ0214-1]|uniref:DUF6532 domain-containing protein n=1 Tax=Ganoderma sinense ZZ0214-1 TaxID=1077348 RepID=A0A2G8S4U1_9APHY|nr:hypothetical protein GSI_08840 [Ganoderma sinense ZZ0214-1]
MSSQVPPKVTRSGRVPKDSERKKNMRKLPVALIRKLQANKLKAAEIAVTSLPTNSTSLKGIPVNLQARKVGLPIRQTSTTTSATKPAKKVAGQRHGEPSSSTPRKLTAEKAAQLAAAQNPFGAVPSGRSASSTPRSSSHSSQSASMAAGPSRPRPTPGRSQVSMQGASVATTPRVRSEIVHAGTSTVKRVHTQLARMPDIDDLYATSDDAADAFQAPYKNHLQVSKIRIQLPEDANSDSQEDIEAGIPHESWIPSSLRKPVKKAIVFLTSGVIDHEERYVEDREDLDAQDCDQQDDGPRENDDDFAEFIREDEHEGEFDDAPVDDDDEYDSDTPLAKRRRPAHRADSDPRSEYPKAARIHERIEGKRPRIADYEADAQHILVAAIRIFKSLVSTDNAYPDKLTELTWAKQAWWEAAEDLDIQLAPNRECVKIITAYSWHLRGEMKTAARNLVETVYRFRASGQTAIQLRNRERAAALRKNDAFVYYTRFLTNVKKRGKTDEEHEGLYQADIIQQMANRLYFKSKKDDGIILKAKYSPFPVVAVAIILAAVECAINEWSSGSFTKVPFMEDQYASVYRHHLRELRKYEAVSDDMQVVTQICQWIYEDGRIYAKAGPDETVVTRSLSANVHAKALADFKRTGGRYDCTSPDGGEDNEN